MRTVFTINHAPEPNYSIRRGEFSSPITAKIKSFETVARGWDYGRGIPASSAMVKLALDAVAQARMIGFADSDAFLAADGSIAIAFYENNADVEIICELDETYSFIFEYDGVDTAEAHGLTLSVLTDELLKAAGGIWNRSFYFSTQGTMTVASKGTGVQRFGLQKAAAPLSFALTVSPLPAAANVITSVNSTPRTLQVTLPFSGAFQKKKYQPAAV